jgi:hypothetical protein
MMKTETEAVLQVNYYGGFVEGDLRWEGRTLYFVPASAWKPGVRYVLKLSGTAYSLDGRELLLSEVIPFFAVISAPVPYLQFVTPQDGASTPAFVPGETVLEFTFSLPMDRRAAEAAFSFDGSGPWHAEWLDDGRVLSIRCEKPLSPWTVYRWSFSEEALSGEGVPLAAQVSGSFITDDDRLRPAPLKIIPLLKGKEEKPGIWKSWIPAGLDFENFENCLGPGQGIGIEFNKPMDGESLRRSLGFSPSLPGRTEDLSPVSAVFIPDRNPDPGVVYTMTISGDVLDSRGLKMGDDYVLFFKADIPFLTINSLTIEREDGIDEIETPARGGSSPAFIDVPGGGVLRFTLFFSFPFTPEAQASETFRISLEPFFPASLSSSPVSLRFVSWLSSSCQVRMEWEGLEAGEEPHYYRLSIPGGRNGINDGQGSYPEENFYFYFEVPKAADKAVEE